MAHYLLIVDHDEHFLENLKTQQTPGGPTLVGAGSLRDAQRKIGSQSTPYAGIFINPSIGTPAWIALVRAASMYQKNTPVFLLLDQMSSLYDKEMDDMGMAAAMLKPCLYSDMLEHIERSKTPPSKILRSHQMLSECNRVMFQILENSSATAQAKLDANLNLGRNVMGIIAAEGLTLENMKFASRYAEHTLGVVQDLAKKSQSVVQLLKNSPSYEHATSTTLIAGAVLSHIGVSSKEMFIEFGVGCFLHDISLVPYGDKFLAEDEAALTGKEKDIFFRHAARSAAILQAMGNVKPAVVEGVAAHHRGREGNRVAELIGISDEAAHLLGLFSGDPEFDLLPVAMKKVQGRYSSGMIRAFEVSMGRS